jgi:gliding motility-associated-like protein
MVVVLFAQYSLGQQNIQLENPFQYVTIGDLDVAGDQITVEALVYNSAANSVNVVSKHTGPGDVNYLLRINTFEITTTNGFILMNNPFAGSMDLDTWYHIAGTYDGSFVRYYVNGCLIVSQPATGNIVTNNHIAAIGNISNGANEQFYGNIDEVRIWSVARTPAELSNNMNDLPNPTTQIGLEAYYKFDGDVLNLQGNATYNGTWVGTPNYGVNASIVDEFDITSVVSQDVSCFGANDGQITISATGTGNQYSIDGGLTWQGSNVFTDLPPGTYSIAAQSAQGCQEFASTVTIVEPALIYTYEFMLACPETDVVVHGNSVSNPGIYVETFPAVNGCDSVSEIELEFYDAPVISVGDDTTICEGASVQLTAIGGGTYNWSHGLPNGSILTPQQTTTYSVIVTDANGCIAEDAITITVLPLPSVAFAANITAGCVPFDVAIESNSFQPGQSCIWSVNNVVFEQCQGLFFPVESPGCYDVSLQITDINGCVNTLTETEYICADPLPQANFEIFPIEFITTANTEVYLNDLSVNASNAQYFWDFGDGTQISGEQNPTHIYPDDSAGNYTIQLIIVSEQGCSDTVYGIVRIAEETIYCIPNAFTPNADQFNDRFIPVFTSGIEPEDFDFRIYNRWGKMVFQSNALDFQWDGTDMIAGTGQLLPDGVYVWMLEYRNNFTDDKVIHMGHVALLK